MTGPIRALATQCFSERCPVSLLRSKVPFSNLWIMARAVGVPGVAFVTALVIGYEIAGIVGVAIAAPTAVLIAELNADLMGE